MSFFQVTIQNWNDLVRLSEGTDSFYFRGHGDAAWQLKTSLEREYYRYEPDRIDSLTNKEHWMLHEFKRKFHLYSTKNFDQSDRFEWLALMQHYGAPTRLLDFTESIYVATFFAVEQTRVDACVWAVYWPGIRDSLRKLCKLEYPDRKLLRDEVNLHHIDFMNARVQDSPANDVTPHLVPLESKFPSERSSKQRGLFLAPATFLIQLASGDLREVGFEENLLSSFGETKFSLDQLEEVTTDDLIALYGERYWSDRVKLLKIVIPLTVHNAFLKHLLRNGLNRETLFSGVEGLATSLALDPLRGL